MRRRAAAEHHDESGDKGCDAWVRVHWMLR
jgi:hypothetical protein